MADQRIRAVVFREGVWWVIQCLEVDLATQVRRLEDVPSELRRLLASQIAANEAGGVEPFFGFSPAPKKFWALYEQAAELMPPTRLADERQIDARLAA